MYGTRKEQNYFKKKEKRLTLHNFTVIKAVILAKGKIHEWDRTENPEIDPHKCNKWIFNQDAKAIQ